MLEGFLWEANVAVLDVPEIVQMRVTAQQHDDATKHGPYCELFLVRRETDPTEPVPARHVGTESLFSSPSRMHSVPLEMTT